MVPSQEPSRVTKASLAGYDRFMAAKLRMWDWLPRLMVVIVLSTLIAGCEGAPSPPASTPASQGTPTVSGSGGEVVVFAASSLQDAFKQLAQNLKSQGINATFNFAGSQALAAQLAQGAQADVFASADDAQMQAAIASGAVVSGTQQVLVTNKLALIVSANNPKVKMLADLTKPGIKIVIADETVPAGKYTLDVLRRMSADASGYGYQFQQQVLANVVSKETNVRQVVAKVELGEADAGFVYATD